jgi:serine/threonine protein phosphatase PrpC
MPEDLVLESAVVSISGPRPENQDVGVAGQRVLAVADGVGGHVAGEVAARLVADVLSADEGNVAAGVARANERLGAAVVADPRLTGMATTLTAAELVGEELVVAHVGDSRAYLLHDGQLQQLTHDQTVVQSLVDAGVITPDEARTHPLRSIVLGALRGADDDLAHLETSSHPVEAGDRVLVCSDGLSGVVPPETLARLLASDRRPAAAATRLVRAALAAGTHDNVTAVVADVLVLAPVQAHLKAGTTRPFTFVA